MLEIFLLIIKLIFALVVILGLIYLSFILSNEKLNKYVENKYIKVLERTQISKEAYILAVKIGEKGYILSVANNNVEKLSELTKDEIINIEDNKKKEKEKLNNKYNIILDNIKNFIKGKK